jgi:hypothetical protein
MQSGNGVVLISNRLIATQVILVLGIMDKELTAHLCEEVSVLSLFHQRAAIVPLA